MFCLLQKPLCVNTSSESVARFESVDLAVLWQRNAGQDCNKESHCMNLRYSPLDSHVHGPFWWSLHIAVRRRTEHKLHSNRNLHQPYSCNWLLGLHTELVNLSRMSPSDKRGTGQWWNRFKCLWPERRVPVQHFRPTGQRRSRKLTKTFYL